MIKRCIKAALVSLAILTACQTEEFPGENDVNGADFLKFCIVVDGKEYNAVDLKGADITVFVPDGTDLTQLVARFKDNAYVVTINGVEQESGVTENSFSGYIKGVKYHLESEDGQKAKDYTVRVLDTRLPAVLIRTADGSDIEDKINWKDASIRIRYANGSITDLGTTGIRGRGNYTWEYYPKKPYALKLGKKQKVLGMPEHKRWALLAGFRGFVGNPMAFEATRRASALGWAPRGEFVELVLNGKFQGMYYLCEQIKVDPNRVAIKSLKEGDIKIPDVTGGYLLEYDELYDEQYKFRSEHFNLPVQLKSPDNNVPDAQFNYIKNYINNMEAEIKKIGTGQVSHYTDYLDIDNFADYWLALEVMNNYEAYKPRSVKMYKGRDGVDSPKGTVCKLKAGPLWDQEWFLVNHEFNSKDMYYYHYLFKDPVFVAKVKERWAIYKSNILGNDKYDSFMDYMQDIFEHNQKSALRDVRYWTNTYFNPKQEMLDVKLGFGSKIEWMDAKINAL